MNRQKPIIIIFFLVMFLFSGCAKEDKEDINDEKYFPVIFNVSSFKQEMYPMSNISSQIRSNLNAGNIKDKKIASTIVNEPSSGSLSDHIVTLEYGVYNKKDLSVCLKWSAQHDYHTPFGTITEELPAGDYKMTIFGATSHSYNRGAWGNYDDILITSIGGGDMFAKSVDFTISDKGESINLIMDRIVGKLEVKITDPIPAHITRIHVGLVTNRLIYLNKFVDNIGKADFLAGMTYNTKPDDIGKSNLILSGFIVPDSNGEVNTDVKIVAYNSSNIEIINKIVKAVKIEKNKKTVLTGALFDGAQNDPLSGFSVNVNNGWNLKENEVTF